jgi:hypothetical protein
VDVALLVWNVIMTRQAHVLWVHVNKGTLNEIVSEIKKYNDKVRELDLND